MTKKTKDKIIDITISLALVVFLALMFLLTGCQTAGKVVESAGKKSLVGDGFLTINKITITDPETESYTPQIFSMFLSGKYVSVLKDAKFLYYSKNESAATLNSNAITKEETLVIQVTGTETIKGVLEELVKKNAAASTEETAAVTTGTETAASDKGE